MTSKEIPNFGASFQKETLPNSVNVFLFKRIGAPISISTLFFAGSRFDSIPGTAHFVEHMLVASTKNYPSKNLLAEKIESVGGSFSASTSKNTVQINIDLAEKEDLPVGINTLREIVCLPTFDESVLETERGAILAEIEDSRSTPIGYVNYLTNNLTFQQTILCNPTIGERDSVKSITQDNLIEYFETYFSSGRVSFVVSGDIEMGDIVTEITNKIQLPTSEKFTRPEDVIFYRKNAIDYEIFENKNSDQIEFKITFPGCSSLKFPDAQALSIIGAALGGGRTSILSTELRYKRGLVYSVGSSASSSLDFGLFSISGGCPGKNIREVLDVISQDITKIVTTGISQEKLDFIKTRIRKSIKRGLQTSGSWVGAHSFDCLFNQDSPRLINEEIENIESITLEQANQVAKKYLAIDSWYFASCGREGVDKFSFKY